MNSKNTLNFSVLLSLFLVFVFLSGCSNEQQNNGLIVPKLNSNYTQISEQPFLKPAKNEVIEFFSYSCIHCFRAQNAVNSFLETKDADTSFIDVPVAFGNNSFFSQIFYTFEELNALDKLHSLFFDAIHIEKLPIRSEADFFAWMSEQGYESEKVKNLFNSTVVRIKTQRSIDLTNRYQINSTPTFVVNGKYSTGPAMTGSHEKTMELIKQLIQ